MARLSDTGKIRLAEANEADLVESQSRNFVYGDFAYSYARYLDSIGQFTPDINGPGRDSAVFASTVEVARFHRNYMRKIHMQQKGAYRRLWFRKFVFDVPVYAWRFIKKLFNQQSNRAATVMTQVSTLDPGIFR